MGTSLLQWRNVLSSLDNASEEEKALEDHKNDLITQILSCYTSVPLHSSGLSLSASTKKEDIIMGWLVRRFSE